MPHYVYERKCLFFTINHIHAYIFFYKTPLRSRSENNSPPNKDLWPMHTNAILNSTICNIPLFSYNIFRPLFSFPLFFVGAACAAAVVVYLHCFSFRWIRYAHVQWPDIKFDGIFHRINALWDIANTHTHKKLALASSSFAAAAFFCFACASQIFQFLFASDKTYEEKIMINGSLDPLEISKRNY